VIYSWKRGKEGVLSFQEDDGMDIVDPFVKTVAER
jgi:hypothetical protein